MRGYPKDNHEEFDRIERLWQDAGHNPVSPAYMARALGKGTGFDTHKSIREVMMIDAVVICGADALAVMKGWKTSRGATMEVALAQSIDIPIFDAETMEVLAIPKTPWAEGFNYL